MLFTEAMNVTYLDFALRLNYKSLIAKNKEISKHNTAYLAIKEEVSKNQMLVLSYIYQRASPQDATGEKRHR